MTKFAHIMISVVSNLLFCLITILLIMLNSRISVAAEWYENGTLHEANFKQWKTATYKNQLATCAGFIMAAKQEKNFLPSIDNMNTLKVFSTQLAVAINHYVNNSEHHNDLISDAALLAMLQLEWIKPEYVSSSRTEKITPKPKGMLSKKEKLPVNIDKTSALNINKRKKRMSSTEGRKWVKKNIIPAMFFSENEFVERFGNYEKVTNSLTNKKTLEKYYFKHIDITFFVVQEDKTLIGFCNGKGYLK